MSKTGIAFVCVLMIIGLIMTEVGAALKIASQSRTSFLSARATAIILMELVVWDTILKPFFMILLYSCDYTKDKLHKTLLPMKCRLSNKPKKPKVPFSSLQTPVVPNSNY